MLTLAGRADSGLLTEQQVNARLFAALAGILLAPITATVMSDCIVHGTIPDSITPFLPERFVA